MKVQLAFLPFLCILFLGIGFHFGRFSAPQVHNQFVSTQHLPKLQLVQDSDPRELQPLPGPGQGFGLPQGSEECPLYFFQDGQFFQMQPGQGFPGQEGSPELFPLQPLPGAPGQPTPPPRPLPEQFSLIPQLLASTN